MTGISNTPAASDEATDQVFRALSSAERRQILLALLKSSPRQESELAGIVPEIDHGNTVSITLHHQHLPHLDKAGYIDTNQENTRISRGDRFEEISPVLRLLDDNPENVPGQWP